MSRRIELDTQFGSIDVTTDVSSPGIFDNVSMFRSLRIPFIFAFVLLAPSMLGASGDARTLSFYHTHTGKQLVVTYFENGDYSPRAMSELRDYLADWRNGEQREIDPALMDILWKIQLEGRHRDTYEVISAYRSPETNELLRGRSKGVARNSQHLVGNAVDIRLRGMDTAVLRDIAIRLELGGVGYYRKSDFVHVDTGRVRYW
jgi:uncharacterized protein YcbK (DUF882 family)